MTKRSLAPRSATGVSLVLGVALLAGPARATEAIAVSLDEDTSTPPPKRRKKADDEGEATVKKVVAPYSLPWQLRPATPVNMFRADTSAAFYGVDGASFISELGFSYKIIPSVALLTKLGFAEDSPPGGAGGFGLFNPLLGGHFGFWPAKSVRIGAFLGLTVPVGLGGGVDPDPGSVDVNRAAMRARGGMDDPLFMPDYLTAWPGLDVAYVTKGFTIQGEVSIAFMTKVRGPETEKSTNVDLTMGVHAGYFLFPFLSVGMDLRHQRWLSTPAFVLRYHRPDGTEDASREIRDITTLGLGPRAHIALDEDVKFRPGLSLSFGLDRPVATSHYKIIQLDLPFTF
jgi:hypothetical protein